MAAKLPSQHPRQVPALQQMLQHVPRQGSGLLPLRCLVHCSNGKTLPATALLNLLVT